jgi:L-ascorbate metabolism protein UlaG (beta-lactamase superfamily)
MDEFERQWLAIQHIRQELVGLDNKPRSRYDRNSFRVEFRDLREYARECRLPFYEKLFEAKEAYHQEEYERAFTLASKARDALLGEPGEVKAEKGACPIARGQVEQHDLTCIAAERPGQCCTRGAVRSKDSLEREEMKDLPSVYGVIALSNMQLAIKERDPSRLDVADKAVVSALRIIAPIYAADDAESADVAFCKLAQLDSKTRMGRCCGYRGSDRRNFQDLFVTACRILLLWTQLDKARGEHARERLVRMLPGYSWAIYREEHPWIRIFAGDAKCALQDAEHGRTHYEAILSGISEHPDGPYYDLIRKNSEEGIRPAPGKVYASVRHARLAEKDGLDETDVLLGELRFDFDAMFWTSDDREKRFEWFLRHPNGVQPPAKQLKGWNSHYPQEPCGILQVDPVRQSPMPTNVYCIPEMASPPPPDVFCVLRSWSSFTPFLPQQWTPNRESRFTSRGGGYFLRWKGHGIAIDPGPSFIRNLYEAGFKIDDVHTVIVTHNHPDHTFEVPSLLNLASQAGPPGGPPKIRNFLLSKNANDVLNRYITLSTTGRDITVKEMYPGDTWELQGPHSTRLVVRALVAHHRDIGAEDDSVSAFGVAFGEPSKKVLVAISSDTHWCPVVERSMKDHILDAQVFVAHVSRVEFREMTKAGQYYEKHLGVLGAFQAIKTVNPRVAVLSEWGEDLAGYRAPIAAAIERAIRLGQPGTGERPRCIPGDRGLRFQFEQDGSAKVLCTASDHRREFEECGESIEPNKVIIDAGLDDGEHRIQYLCEAHRS